jgi:hypothetical protein
VLFHGQPISCYKVVATKSSEAPVSSRVFASTPLIGMKAFIGGDLAKGVSEVFALGTTLIVGTVVRGITLRASCLQ